MQIALTLTKPSLGVTMVRNGPSDQIGGGGTMCRNDSVEKPNAETKHQPKNRDLHKIILARGVGLPRPE